MSVDRGAMCGARLNLSFRRGKRLSAFAGKVLEGASLEGASVCNLSLERHHGNGMSLPALEPRGASGRRHVSRRGYKKLFFDCGLHLVLQQLLQRSSLSRTDGTPSPSVSAEAFSTEGNAEDDLTDTDVARLLRRHLNILVGSQEASDAEVVAAARVLEQKFRPLLKAVPEDSSNKRHENSANQSTNSRSTEDRPASHSSSGEGGPSEEASQEATGCWSGGFCVEASQVEDECEDDGENGVSAESSDHRASGALAALVLSQTQDSQLTGPNQLVASAEALPGDESSTNRRGESPLTTRTSQGQPAKKLCVGPRNWH
ncbi:hypothetical protein Esti_005887 [Eimeria stiedai]